MRRLICSLAAAARWAALALPPASLPLLSLAIVLPLLSACTPGIGDKCTQSTDCSVTGTLVCDTSQSDGYCTVLNCTDNSCPNSAVCVMFQSTVPGCAYDDYQSPSRTGRSFCMAHCSRDSDCRESEGYSCRDPRAPPWNAAILDDNQSQGVCIVAPGLVGDASTGAAAPTQGDAAVCLATRQDGQASQESDAGADGGSNEAGDARADGGDAAIDASPDAGDAAGGVEDGGADGQSDAPNDASGDAGSADAPAGG